MKITTRDIFRILTAATLFILFLAFLYQILSIIGMIAAALLLTLLFDPLVDWIQKKLPGKKRGIAIVITLLGFIISLIFLGFLIVRPMISEMPNLVGELQNVSEKIKNSETTNQALEYVEPLVTEETQMQISNTTKDVISGMGDAIIKLIGNISSFIYVFITVITLMFFMLLDTKKALAAGSKIVPEKYHSVYHKLTVDLYGIVTKYFAGALMVAAIAGISTFVFLKILNIPYAASLSVIVAVFDLIPMIGATLGAIIVVLFSLLYGNITAAVILTIYFIIYQQVENNAIIPLVQKKTVKMSPLAVLIALMIGGAISGIVGALLAIPAAAFIKVAYDTFKSEGLIGN